jgi:hypothetical protein
MKLLNSVFLVAATSLIATGCFSRREVIHERAGAPAPVREIVVMETPPAPQVEAMGVTPGPDYVWMSGHWTRSGDRWVWTSGRWELRPSATSIYMPGHWEKRGAGYVWREGYWK